MRIEVTQEDINAGVIGDCEKCPVARAVVRQTKVRVKVQRLYLERCDTRERCSLPHVACWAIRDYDLDRGMLPFSMEIPDDFLEAAHASEGGVT